jgi:hypothetical protein
MADPVELTSAGPARICAPRLSVPADAARGYATWPQTGLGPARLGGPARAGWTGREAARTPARFRDRVLALFRAPENLAYLHALLGTRVPRGPARDYVLATLHDALYTYSEGEGRAYDLLTDDPLARRGANRPAVSAWAEVRRLNRAFFADRLAFLREQTRQLEGGAPRDGVADDDEPYHQRMFIADSLRPPGLERLNTPGPLWALREDQAAWGAVGPLTGGPRQKKERFTVRHDGDVDFAVYGPEDTPWSAADPYRTPERAVAEYWGDHWAATETTTGAPELAGQAYGAAYAWGDSWRENGGTRFMRYENGPPFWQKGGREGYDYDIEETLGTQARELDAPVRRWDLDRVRHPRGQEYRQYGQRSGHVV